ncbi:MAG: 50S ribosomal protein L19, partial [bacterium]|nr:50S ribosomal protein L19 [bacterium]
VRRSRLYYLRNLSGKKARIAAIDTRGQELLAPTEPTPEVVPVESLAETAEETTETTPAAPETSEEKPAEAPAEEKKE